MRERGFSWGFREKTAEDEICQEILVLSLTLQLLALLVDCIEVLLIDVQRRCALVRCLHVTVCSIESDFENAIAQG